MDHDRLRLTAKGQLAGGFEREAMSRQRVGGLGDQDGAGRRGGQQARRRVHRVTGHRVRGARGGAEASRDDRAAVDADVEHHALAESRRPSLAELRAALEHLQRRVQRALRVVFVSDRRAEDRHDGIAHEFLDEAVVALDRLRQRREERVLEGANLLGIEPL